MLVQLVNGIISAWSVAFVLGFYLALEDQQQNF